MLADLKLAKSVMEEATKRWRKKESREPKFTLTDNPKQDLIQLQHQIKVKYLIMREHLTQAKEIEMTLKELRGIKEALEVDLTPVTYASFPKKKSKIDRLSDAELMEMAKDGRLEEMVKELARKGVLNQFGK